MGGYNEVTLDWDRTFDVNSLNELLARSFLNGFCGGFANGCITAVVEYSQVVHYWKTL